MICYLLKTLISVMSGLSFCILITFPGILGCCVVFSVIGIRDVLDRYRAKVIIYYCDSASLTPALVSSIQDQCF